MAPADPHARGDGPGAGADAAPRESWEQRTARPAPQTIASTARPVRAVDHPEGRSRVSGGEIAALIAAGAFLVLVLVLAVPILRLRHTVDAATQAINDITDRTGPILGNVNSHRRERQHGADARCTRRSTASTCSSPGWTPSRATRSRSRRTSPTSPPWSPRRRPTRWPRRPRSRTGCAAPRPGAGRSRRRPSCGRKSRPSARTVGAEVSR